MQGRLFDSRTLATMTLEERLDYLSGVLSIPKAALAEFGPANSQTPVIDKIRNLSLLLYEALLEKGVSKHSALGHITYPTLHAVLTEDSSDWWNNILIAQAIQREFGEVQYHSHLRVTRNVPKIAGLRKWVSEQTHGRTLYLNVAKAADIWGPDVTFSYVDMIKGTKLPSIIDARVSFLLGVLYFSSINLDRHRIDMSLPEYYSGLRPIIQSLYKQIFNNEITPVERSHGTELYSYSQAIS